MGAPTNTTVRNLKPRATAYQIADDKELTLEVRPSGQKAWLYRYRLFGRRKNFHPEVIRAFR